MTETWRDIPGLGGRRISDTGRVWTPAWGGRILPLHKRTVRGRRANITVTFQFGGTKITRSVHRLVLEAFIGPCPDGMEGCHGNGDPWDNRLENLRWDTHASNMADAEKHGTFQRGPGFTAGNTLARGEKNTRATLTNEQAGRIKDRLRTGERPVDLAEDYGVTANLVSKIKHGKAWAWL